MILRGDQRLETFASQSGQQDITLAAILRTMGLILRLKRLGNHARTRMGHTGRHTQQDRISQALRQLKTMINHIVSLLLA